MSCETPCINERRIHDLEKDIERNTITHKEFFQRFESMNERMVGYEKDMSYLRTTISTMSEDLKEIKEKPAKRWESAVLCAITSIVSVVVGFLLSGGIFHGA